MARRTVVVVGDLAGPDRYHAGDEAMTEAALDLLASERPASERPASDLRVVVTSSDPASTAGRLRCEATGWVGFAQCADEAARLRMLDVLTADVGAALRSSDTTGLPDLLAEVVGADAVLIAGGGNLNSHWPEHLYERVLIARAAKAVGIPVAISGQTLGPRIDDHHRALLVELMASSDVVGLREHRSYDLAVGLGVDPDRLMLQADDALLLAGSQTPTLPDGFDPGTPDRPRRFLAVTVHPFAAPDDPRMASIGAQLATVAHRVGAQLLFVPHMRGPEGPDGTTDADVANHLAHITGGWAMESPDAGDVIWAARHAWVVVSTRYHPVVFATGAAVAPLALLWDHYTAVKCRGALDHVGLGSWWVGINEAADGALEPALAEVTRRRTEIVSWLHLNQPRLESLDAHRRSRITAALGLTERWTPDPPGIARGNDGQHHPANGGVDPDLRSPGRTAPRPAGHWTQSQR
jgi:polysaccharide pyruvyl transferase WcaK-like protein